MPTTTVQGNLTGPVLVLATVRVDPFFPALALGALGIILGGAPVDWEGDGVRSLQFGARFEGTEGTPTAPSLALDWWGFWRWRWVVDTGTRSVTIYTKQASNVAGRPSVVLKANAAVGLAADVTAVAGSSTGWIAVTASFNCTAPGMVWVELHNNCLGIADTCYFDRISVI